MHSSRQEWIEFIGGEENLDYPLGDGVFPSASDYIKANVTLEEYQQWYAVNGWDIERMKQLVDADIDIQALGALTTEGDTIAYSYCNGDLSLEDVQRLITD